MRNNHYLALLEGMIYIMSKNNFEESMKNLENIVTELENGNLNCPPWA